MPLFSECCWSRKLVTQTELEYDEKGYYRNKAMGELDDLANKSAGKKRKRQG